MRTGNYVPSLINPVQWLAYKPIYFLIWFLSGLLLESLSCTLDIYLTSILYLLVPKLFWGPLMLVHFLFILIYIGVLPHLYQLFRSLSVGLRRCYICCKLVLFPKRRTYRRRRCRLRFRRFHRRRLAYHSFPKCLT